MEWLVLRTILPITIDITLEWNFCTSNGCGAPWCSSLLSLFVRKRPSHSSSVHLTFAWFHLYKWSSFLALPLHTLQLSTISSFERWYISRTVTYIFNRNEYDCLSIPCDPHWYNYHDSQEAQRGQTYILAFKQMGERELIEISLDSDKSWIFRKRLLRY